MNLTKAILMAAGRGTRISREIKGSCKCTLDIGGISLIRHTVSMLLDHGIEPHVVVGYNKKHIYKALAGLDVTFHENVFYSVTNSLASLWFAREELRGGDIILGNADVYWDERILSLLLEEERDCAMLCDFSRVEQGDYLFHVNEDSSISAYGKGLDCKNANSEYVGLAIVRGELVDRCRENLCRKIDAQKHHQWWEQVLYDMVPKRPIWAKDVDGLFWAEIDYIEDYQRIVEYRENHK